MKGRTHVVPAMIKRAIDRAGELATRFAQRGAPRVFAAVEIG